MTDPFDRWLDEEDAMCDDQHEQDANAPHGSNTEDEMDVGATPGEVLRRLVSEAPDGSPLVVDFVDTTDSSDKPWRDDADDQPDP